MLTFQCGAGKDGWNGLVFNAKMGPGPLGKAVESAYIILQRES